MKHPPSTLEFFYPSARMKEFSFILIDETFSALCNVYEKQPAFFLLSPGYTSH